MTPFAVSYLHVFKAAVLLLQTTADGNSAKNARIPSGEQIVITWIKMTAKLFSYLMFKTRGFTFHLHFLKTESFIFQEQE